MIEANPNSEVSPPPFPGREVVKINNWVDRIDRKADLTAWLSRFTFPSLMLACAGSVRAGLEAWGNRLSPEFIEQNHWLQTLYNSVSNTSLGVNFVEIGSIASVTGYILYENWRRNEGHLFYGHVLRTTGEDLVYKGKEPLPGFPGITTGERLLYLSLSRPEPEAKLTPDAVKLYGEATRLAIEGIRLPADIKALVIDPESFTAQTPLEHQTRVPNAQLLSGKDIRPSAGESIVIPVDDLDKLQFNLADELSTALERLKDSELSYYFSEAQSATSEEDLKIITSNIKKHLGKRLSNHVLGHFAAPVRRKLAEPPYFRKTHELVELFTNRAGKMILKTGNNDYGFVLKELHSALGVEEGAKVQELDPSSPHYKGQLYYIVSELVRKNSIGDLVEPPEIDPEVVAQKLSELGFPVAESSDALKTLADTRIRLDLFKQIERAFLPITVAALLYLSGPSLEKIAKSIDVSNLPDIVNILPKSVNQFAVSYLSSSDISVNSTHRPNALGIQPPRTVDWDITVPQDSRLQNGYYTLETAHRMERGEWVISQDRSTVLHLPKVPRVSALQIDLTKDENYMGTGDYVEVSRRLELPFVNNYRFKLPTREETKLAYLDIDLDSDKYTVYELTDGTYEIEIRQDLFNFVTVAEIRAVFTHTLTPQIKAVTPITPLDETKIDPENVRQIAEIKAAISGEEFLIAIARKVATQHRYSIGTENSDQLKKATTIEEMVDIIFHDSLCDCDTCNSEAGAETTLGQTDDNFVNVAYGYLNGVHILQPDKKLWHGILRGDTFHAYLYSNKGRIIDATATVLNGDEATAKYLRDLEVTQEDIKLFGDREQALIKKYFNGSSPGDFLNILRAVAGLSLGGGLYFGARFLSNYERRRKITQTAMEAEKSLFLGTLSKEDLELAWEFFPWMSFGQDTVMPRPRSVDLTKPKLLEKIQENYTRKALRSYSADRQSFEQEAGINGWDAWKMRYIALFLPKNSGLKLKLE